MQTFDDFCQINNPAGTFPDLFMIDEGWASTQPVVLEHKTKTSVVLADSHSVLTLGTILSIAPGIKPFAIGLKRNNKTTVQPRENVVDALFACLVHADLKAGDVLIVNLEIFDNESIVSDEFCVGVLKELHKKQVVTVVAAGNKTKDLPISFSHQSIVVGAVGAAGFCSNYGVGVTCYADAEVNIGGEVFTDSSAATAQVAGLVMQMQKYANSKGRFLSPEETKTILGHSGNKMKIILTHKPSKKRQVNIPSWAAAKAAIDVFMP